MKICYHASPLQVIGATQPFAAFNAYSHFGSKEAAIGALIAKECKNGYLYQVELNVLPTQVVDLSEDWGSPRLLPLLSGLANFVEDTDAALFKKLADARAKCLFAKRNKELAESERLANNALLEYCFSCNVRAFSYPNIVEGDEGELSYCVVHPRDITTISCREVTTEELEESRRYLSEFRLRTLGGITDQ